MELSFIRIFYSDEREKNSDARRHTHIRTHTRIHIHAHTCKQIHTKKEQNTDTSRQTIIYIYISLPAQTRTVMHIRTHTTH